MNTKELDQPFLNELQESDEEFEVAFLQPIFNVTLANGFIPVTESALE